MSDRRFYTRIPNIVDDMELSVHAYRLYGHIRRVAGESGQCWKGARELGRACNMSKNTVTRAKQELRDRGLIAIAEKVGPGGNVHLITVSDIWSQNHEKYTPESVPDLGRSKADQHDSGSNLGRNTPESVPDLGQADQKSVPNQGTEELTLKQQEKPKVEEKPMATAPPSPNGSAKNRVRKSLELHFSEITQLPCPPTGTAKQKRAAAATWWDPLRSIAELVEWREQDGKDLIDASLQRCNGLTISSPKSILNTATAIIGEVKRGSYRPPGEAKSNQNLREFIQREGLHGI